MVFNMGKQKQQKKKKKSLAKNKVAIDDDAGGNRSMSRSTAKRGKKKEKYVVVNQNPRQDDDFRAQLEADGSRVINEMTPDGNCLFRALSDQLYNDHGRRHGAVRNDICDSLEANEELFKGFVVLEEDEEEENVASFEEYLWRMRRDGEWGGNPELVSASRLYKRSITIFSEVGAFSIDSGMENNDGRDLQLSYHDNDHYNSVLTDESSSSIAEKKRAAVMASSIAEKKRAAVMADSPSTEKSANNGQIPAEPAADQKTAKYCRNHLCVCGSGVKYKRCCMEADKRKAKTSRMIKKYGIQEPSRDDERESEKIDGLFKVLQI